jgi:hypothetical protein
MIRCGGFAARLPWQAVEKLLRSPSAALRGAHTLAYLVDMSQVLRSVRLASGLPHDVFQQPASKFAAAEGRIAGFL